MIVLNEPHLTLHDGTPVLIRRLVAEDAALYPDFRSDVTAEDLRLRFFAPMREVSHELLDKLIHLGDVLYWTASGLAVIIVAFIVWTAVESGLTDYVFTSIILGAAALIWLFGRACRYVLAGR